MRCKPVLSIGCITLNRLFVRMYCQWVSQATAVAEHIFYEVASWIDQFLMPFTTSNDNFELLEGEDIYFLPEKEHPWDTLLFCLFLKKTSGKLHRPLVSTYWDKKLSETPWKNRIRWFRKNGLDLSHKARWKRPRKVENKQLQAFLDKNDNYLQNKLGCSWALLNLLFTCVYVPQRTFERPEIGSLINWATCRLKRRMNRSKILLPR